MTQNKPSKKETEAIAEFWKFSETVGVPEDLEWIYVVEQAARNLIHRTEQKITSEYEMLFGAIILNLKVILELPEKAVKDRLFLEIQALEELKSGIEQGKRSGK